MHENLLDGMRMKILILGGTGFVGRNLARHVRDMGHEVIAVGKVGCDISISDSVHSPFSWLLIKMGENLDAVINATGNKDLSKCNADSQDEFYYGLNSSAPSDVAFTLRQLNIPFIHISTDHVLAEPITLYGIEKALGEQRIIEETSQALIIRTGHVYDNDCPWVRWLDGELKAGRTVEAWTDIVARPTYARNLAGMILDLLQRKVTGTVNCVSKRLVTRLELFATYADRAGYNPDLVVPCPTPCPSPYHIRKLYCECTYDGPIAVQDITEGFRRMLTERTRDSDTTAAIMAFNPENPYA